MNIIDYLKSLPNETIYYHANYGNAGDSLITLATFQLFRKCNINVKTFSINDKLVNKILIYGGGGNFTSHSNYASCILKKFHEISKKFIILPHTINDNEELLKKVNNNVDIICRENISYNHVKKNATKANVFLMNDLAFSLDLKNAFSYKNKYNFNNFKNRTKILLKYLLHTYKITKPGKDGILNSFRQDIEATNIDIPKDNIDASKVFALHANTEDASHLVSYKLLNFLNQYNEINTNRLHICIAGILLNKKINFFPNSYYKNEAVYNFSIKNIFKNVTWIKN